MDEKNLKKLPLGLSDFRKIITGDYVYVDKTQLIHQMITGGEYYFISRPRRFGKSLLVSTLAELFSGNKELFKNLWIGSSDYDWPQYPVIRFDFSAIGHRTTTEFIANMHAWLDGIVHDKNINVSSNLPIDSKFREIIVQLSKINKVAILIDEYHKPILDHIDDMQEAKEQREILKSLYSVIKGSDQYLRFVLLTGVSKFSKTSVFSGINNLYDISLSEKYAILFGYTEQELYKNFVEHLEQFVPVYGTTIGHVVTRLRDQYDGYSFSRNAEQVFNPYSVLTCLTEKKLGNYWFASGTPTVLIRLIQQQDYDIDTITHPVVNETSLDAFEPDDIELAALLFQTGYLTIKNFDSKTSNYTLGVPNREVHNGLTIQLADVFTGLQANKSIQYARIIARAFIHNDMEELAHKLQEFFNKMPYTVHIKSESQLQFVLYAIFALIGVTVDPEVVTSLGRADLIVTFPKLVYVIELKFNGSAAAALAQIQDKKYCEKYENTGKQIMLVGINFDEPTKTVSLEACGV